MTVHDLEIVAEVERDLHLDFGICDHHRKDQWRVQQIRGEALVRFQRLVESEVGMELLPDHLRITDNGRDLDDPDVTRYTVHWEAPLHDVTIVLRGGELDGMLVTVERIDGLVQVMRKQGEIACLIYATSGWSDTQHCWVADLVNESSNADHG